MSLNKERNPPGAGDTESCVPHQDSNGKRAGWPDEAPVFSLDESGVIQKCSDACERLFGYRSHDLVERHISTLYPQLSGVNFFPGGRFNTMLDFLSRCGHPFQASNSQGEIVKSELSFVRIEQEGRRGLRVIVRSSKQTRRYVGG